MRWGEGVHFFLGVGGMNGCMGAWDIHNDWLDLSVENEDKCQNVNSNSSCVLNCSNESRGLIEVCVAYCICQDSVYCIKSAACHSLCSKTGWLVVLIR
jgi:hypothetical protein